MKPIKKNINLFLLFCIIFNTIIPAVSLDANDCNAVISPSPLLSLFSALKVPFNQTNKFVNEENPLVLGFTASKNKKNDDGTNSSTDYFLPNPSKNSKSIEKDVASQKLADVVKVEINHLTFLAFSHYRNYCPPGETNFAYLILLAYLVLLAITNLPWLLGAYRRSALTQSR